MITSVMLINTFTTSHSYVCVCVCVVRTLKIYYLSNFKVYNRVLLTIVIMLYIRSPEIISLITELIHLINCTL